MLDGLFALVRSWFASICYHYQFLTKTLQPTSHVLTSAIFMNIPDDIMKMVKVFTYKQVNQANGCGDAPHLTGIPPHIVVINNLNEVSSHVTECSTSVVRQLKQELEDHFVGGRGIK